MSETEHIQRLIDDLNAAERRALAAVVLAAEAGLLEADHDVRTCYALLRRTAQDSDNSGL
jgi:hypothetical protein